MKGPFFDEAEFHTLFGLTREQVAAVVDQWPGVYEGSEEVYLAINNSMGNLIRYPHGHEAEVEQHVSFPIDVLKRIFAKWKHAR